ncbi:MAG: glyceraldehyde 3-phosphate dehydrogenase NAD-binding domain-containing protein [Pseudohongiellaceae bacterium]
MAYRIAINGYGRIGRCVLRALYESTDYPELRIVALNDPADTVTLAHLTRYDSTHGRFLGNVAYGVAGDSDKPNGADELIVDGDVLAVYHHLQPSQLPWRDLGVDLVMECSGAFSDRATAAGHIDSGAGRLLFSQPAENDVDATVVYGVNHDTLKAGDRIISNASCTTNCIVPVIRCLDESFGIENGVLTTIHSAMNDQPVIDAYHHNDLRKTRSAMQSIIPVNTELARGIYRILPHLQDRFEAQAMRVPTVNVSAIDLSVVLSRECTVAAVNEAMMSASRRLPLNVLGCTSEPLTSCDFNHDPRSAIVDLTQTRVSGKHLLKMLTWFDNEWAYANRMLDVAQYLHTQFDDGVG